MRPALAREPHGAVLGVLGDEQIDAAGELAAVGEETARPWMMT